MMITNQDRYLGVCGDAINIPAMSLLRSLTESAGFTLDVSQNSFVVGIPREKYAIHISTLDGGVTSGVGSPAASGAPEMSPSSETTNGINRNLLALKQLTSRRVELFSKLSEVYNLSLDPKNSPYPKCDLSGTNYTENTTNQGMRSLLRKLDDQISNSEQENRWLEQLIKLKHDDWRQPLK